MNLKICPIYAMLAPGEVVVVSMEPRAHYVVHIMRDNGAPGGRISCPLDTYRDALRWCREVWTKETGDLVSSVYIQEYNADGSIPEMKARSATRTKT